jgi:hypothetical protein
MPCALAFAAQAGPPFMGKRNAMRSPELTTEPMLASHISHKAVIDPGLNHAQTAPHLPIEKGLMNRGTWLF